MRLVTLLSLKNELRGKGIYGVSKEFQSVDVYESVLNHKAKTVEDIRDYKKLTR
jgi:hypothetical protein